MLCPCDRERPERGQRMAELEFKTWLARGSDLKLYIFMLSSRMTLHLIHKIYVEYFISKHIKKHYMVKIKLKTYTCWAWDNVHSRSKTVVKSMFKVRCQQVFFCVLSDKSCTARRALINFHYISNVPTNIRGNTCQVIFVCCIQ